MKAEVRLDAEMLASSLGKFPSKAPANWADMNDLEDDSVGVEGLVKEDAEGNRVITSYYREEDGRQMKIERKVVVHRRTQLVVKAIKERQKNWNKFGFDRLNFEEGENKRVSIPVYRHLYLSSFMCIVFSEFQTSYS